MALLWTRRKNEQSAPAVAPAPNRGPAQGMTAADLGQAVLAEMFPGMQGWAEVYYEAEPPLVEWQGSPGMSGRARLSPLQREVLAVVDELAVPVAAGALPAALVDQVLAAARATRAAVADRAAALEVALLADEVEVLAAAVSPGWEVDVPVADALAQFAQDKENAGEDAWFAPVGPVPAGLEVDPRTGQVSGVPVTGDAGGFVVALFHGMEYSSDMDELERVGYASFVDRDGVLVTVAAGEDPALGPAAQVADQAAVRGTAVLVRAGMSELADVTELRIRLEADLQAAEQALAARQGEIGARELVRVTSLTVARSAAAEFVAQARLDQAQQKRAARVQQQAQAMLAQAARARAAAEGKSPAD